MIRPAAAPEGLFPEIGARMRVLDAYLAWRGRLPWRWCPQGLTARLYPRIRGS